MEEATRVTVSKHRKKLWELGQYHCSIVGTCFSRTALRKIARRKEFSLPQQYSDYLLHNALVNLAARKGPRSKALQKILDRKFRRVITRFAKVKTESGVRELWQEYLEKGSLTGSYWAVLTHPATTSELAAEAYGEIHMIGYDFTLAYQLQSGQIEILRAENRQTRASLAEEKSKAWQMQQALNDERQELEQMREAYDCLQREHESLGQKVLQLESTNVGCNRSADRELIRQLQQDNAMLCGQADQLADELDRVKVTAELAANAVRELGQINDRLIYEKQSFEQEIVSLEMTLMGKLPMISSCEKCSEQNSEDCPGPGLCGKTVLYVGGLHNMVPHYKQLVERHGGVFIHHDGGRESSRAILPKMLCGADAVLCPVDCVSHDACKSVKKICKRYQKPFVMMRSSGLSSLAKGLSEIMVVQ
ncbi:MAG: DUF2325 domain-containing protein [Desulfopila sp.]